MVIVREGARVVALRLPDGSLQLQPREVLEEVLQRAAEEGLFVPSSARLLRQAQS